MDLIKEGITTFVKEIFMEPNVDDGMDLIKEGITTTSTRCSSTTPCQSTEWT